MLDDTSHASGRFAALDEVITLVGEIERRFESCNQVEERRVDLCDAACQRPFELIEGNTSLKRRRGLDQVSNRLRLYEISLSIEKCAECKFAGNGQAGAGGYGTRHNRTQHDRTAVRADLDNVLTGIRIRRGKIRDDDFVDNAARASRPDPRARGVPRAKRMGMFEDGGGDIDG
jgi:hypothetical protein